MDIKWGQIAGAAIIGFLVGMAYCYWKAITAVYQNKDLISSGVNAVTAGQDLYDQLRKI